MNPMGRVLLLTLLLPAACANLAEQDPYPSGRALDDASREIARQAEREGDYGLAASMLARLRNQLHAPATLAREQARMLMLAGRLDEADEVLNAYLERAPGDVIGRRQSANLFLARDLPDAALVVLDKGQAKDKGTLVNDAQWQNTRGAVLDRLGRHADAREAYQSGLAASPGDVTIIANMAVSFLMSGDRAAALEVIDRLPLDEVLQAGQGWNLALVLVANGRGDQARKILVSMGRGDSAGGDLGRLAVLRALPPAELRRALGPRTLVNAS